MSQYLHLSTEQQARQTHSDRLTGVLTDVSISLSDLLIPKTDLLSRTHVSQQRPDTLPHSLSPVVAVCLFRPVLGVCFLHPGLTPALAPLSSPLTILRKAS